jgi:hypothetical protein
MAPHVEEKLHQENKGVMHAVVGCLEDTVFDNDCGKGGVTGAKGALPFKKVELE